MNDDRVMSYLILVIDISLHNYKWEFTASCIMPAVLSNSFVKLNIIKKEKYKLFPINFSWNPDLIID